MFLKWNHCHGGTDSGVSFIINRKKISGITKDAFSHRLIVSKYNPSNQVKNDIEGISVAVRKETHGRECVIS